MRGAVIGCRYDRDLRRSDKQISESSNTSATAFVPVAAGIVPAAAVAASAYGWCF